MTAFEWFLLYTLYNGFTFRLRFLNVTLYVYCFVVYGPGYNFLEIAQLSKSVRYV